MIEKGLIVQLAEEAIRETDLFLVEVKMKPNDVIEVYLDSDTAVNIDQCVAVSRFIESEMGRDVQDFELSVLSYGLSGALKLPRQFAKRWR